MKHKQRIKTGLALILVCCILFFTLGNVSFPLIENDSDFIVPFQWVNLVVLGIVFLMGMIELSHNTIEKNKTMWGALLWLFLISAMLYDLNVFTGEIVIFTSALSNLGFFVGGLIKSAIAIVVIVIIMAIKTKKKFTSWYIPLVAVLCLAPSMINFLLISDLYVDFMLLLFAAVLYDVLGFFGGTYFGKKKIFPTISPSKTLGGTIIGVMGSTGTIFAVYGLVYILGNNNIPLLLKSKDDLYEILVFTTFFALSAMSGDLLFSKVKRILKIKDYSNLLPSHGGVLDRVDGILTALSMFSIIIPLVTLTE